MSAAGVQLLMSLFGHMLYGGQPQANPEYTKQQQLNSDPNYNGPVDSNLPKMTPYRQPGPWESLLAPEVANREWTLNNQGNQALLDDQNQFRVAQQQVGRLGPVQGLTPDQQAEYYRHSPTAGGQLANATAQNEIGDNVQGITAATDKLFEQNKGRSELAKQNVGIPQGDVDVQKALNDLTLGSRVPLEYGQNANQQWWENNGQPRVNAGRAISAQGTLNTAPVINDINALNAQTERDEAGSRSRLEPTTYEARQVEGQYDALHPNDPYNPRAGFFLDGRYYPGQPDFKTAMNNSMTGGMQQPVTLSSGLSGQVARPSYQPTISGSLLSNTHGSPSYADDWRNAPGMRPYVDPVPTASNPTTETTGYHDNPDVQSLTQQAREEHDQNGVTPRYKQLVQKLEQLHNKLDEETPQQKVTRTINEYVKSISNPVEEKKKKDYINATQNLNDLSHVRTNTSNTY